MHGDRLAEYYGGIGNFVYTRARVPEHVWAQFIVREDKQIQLQERLAFALMFGIFCERTTDFLSLLFLRQCSGGVSNVQGFGKGVA